jgi:hypothetical protein
LKSRESVNPDRDRKILRENAHQGHRRVKRRNDIPKHDIPKHDIPKHDMLKITARGARPTGSVLRLRLRRSSARWTPTTTVRYRRKKSQTPRPH